MIRSFFKDSILYGIAQILFFGIPIMLAPLFSRYLSPDAFGALEILQISALLVNFIVALEIGQGLARFYAGARDDAERRSYASTSFWHVLVCYAAFVAVSLMFSKPLIHLLLGGQSSWTPEFQLAVLSTASTGIFFSLQNQLRWDLKAAWYARSSLVYAFVSTSIAILAVVKQGWGLSGIFGGQIVAAGIACVISYIGARERYGRTFSRARWRQMLAYSIPLVFSSMAIFFASFLDRFSIRYLMDLQAVGVYSIGYRFASVVNVAFLGMGYALTPLIYRDHADPNTPIQIERLFRLFVGLAVVAFVGLALLSEILVKKLTTPHYYSAAALIPVLALSALFSRFYVFAPGLELAKKTRQIAAINVSAALINAVINFVFIPHFGVMAAAVGTLLASIFMAGSYLRLNQRLYPVPFRFGKICGVWLFAFAAIAFDHLLINSDLLAWFSPASVIVKFGLGVATLGVAVALLTLSEEKRNILNLIARKTCRS